MGLERVLTQKYVMIASVSVDNFHTVREDRCSRNLPLYVLLSGGDSARKSLQKVSIILVSCFISITK